MTPDEYWLGDPSLLYNYEKAWEMRQKYDLEMAWTMGSFFRSALGSTPLWTIQPAKKSDWKYMPEYIKNPVKDYNCIPKKPISEEKQQLLEKTKAKLNILGLLEKE